MTDITTVTPPAGEPVSLAAVKAYLRLGHTGEDGLAADLLASARAQIETEAGLALVTRTLKLTLKDWPATLKGQGVRLRPGPVTALIAVQAVDALGVTDDVTSRFLLNNGRLCLRAWSFAPPVPVDGRIEIDFDTGFGAPGAVPEDLQLAVKLLASHAYQRRDDRLRTSADGMPEDVAQILSSYQNVRL